MEIEETSDRPRSQRHGTKSNPFLARSDSMINSKHSHPSKNSLNKPSSDDQTESINRIEEMIQAIQIFPKRRKNADKTECKFCHFCKAQCEKQFLLHCTIEDCLLYFCLRCINQKFKTSLVNLNMIMKSETWSCPSCCGECTCQICQFKTSLEHETKAANNNRRKGKIEEIPKEQIVSVENSPTKNHSAQRKKEKTHNHNHNHSKIAEKKTSSVKKPSAKSEISKPKPGFVQKENIKVSPNLKGNTIRLTRKSTRSKDELRMRKKALSPIQVDSSPEPRQPRMATRLHSLTEITNEEKKSKTTRKATRTSEKSAKININVKKVPSVDGRSSPSIIEESEKSSQSVLSTKYLSSIKKNKKKRNPSPSVDSVDEEFEASDQLEKNEETNSQHLNKKILRRGLKKTSSQKRKISQKTQKKRISRSRRLRDEKLEEDSAKMKEENQVEEQRKMLTRASEKIVSNKRMASTSSESEKSDFSFEIKKINETKNPKERKDEWNENNKRVLHISSGEEEYILEDEEENTYKADDSYHKSSPVIEQELSPKKKGEKIIIETSQCHYCNDFALEEKGMTCSDKTCHIFFCSHCLRKHPEEDSDKRLDVKNWKCLVCEDRCTCIDCLQTHFHPKSNKKDIPKKDKTFQEYIAQVRHNRNDISINEDLDALFDDNLEGYTLKKKKDNGNNELNVANPAEENRIIPEPPILEKEPIIEQSQINLTEMLSEKNSLITPDGIVDVNECQWYLAQSVSNNNER